MADDFDPTTAPASQEGASKSGTPARETPVRERTDATVKKPSGLKFDTTTLLLLGFVSLCAQLIAASTFDIAEYFIWDVRSTGGLVAVIAGIVTSVKCRSWESWRN